MKALFLTAMLVGSLISPSGQDTVARLDGDTLKINTSTLCQSRGYKSKTPLEVSFRDGRIVKITPLRNYESPGYFRRVRIKLFPKLIGLSAKDVAKNDVDAVSGATYSSQAVIDNVRAAAQYYRKNK